MNEEKVTRLDRKSTFNRHSPLSKKEMKHEENEEKYIHE